VMRSNASGIAFAVFASFTILERPSSHFEIVTALAPRSGVSAAGAQRQSRFAGRSRAHPKSEIPRVPAPDAWQIRGSINP
jgi:hypothetical protein